MTNRHLWTLLIDGRRYKIRVAVLTNVAWAGRHEIFVDLGDGHDWAEVARRTLGAREGAMIPFVVAGRTLVVHIEDAARHNASLVVPGL
jgi:hypothetical protein